MTVNKMAFSLLFFWLIATPCKASITDAQIRSIIESLPAKAGFALKQFLIQYKTAQSTDVGEFIPSIPHIRTMDNKLVVDITTNGNAGDVLESLGALGLEHGAVFHNQISGLLPYENIELMLAHQGIRYANASMMKISTGIVDTQGDQSMQTDTARIAFGVSGAGITIGTISDSANADPIGALTTFADDINSNDLPSDVVILPPLTAGTDEGRAMMQILHDIAPGAKLYFRTGSLGEADMANAIADLVNAGVAIINDDVFYFSEPMFQDGIIAQVATLAVNAGRHYFSAAGNQGNESYQAPFTPSGLPAPVGSAPPMGVALSGGNAHDFDPGPGIDIQQHFLLSDGDTLELIFQWAQPFVSACQGVCPGPLTNLDIGLFDPIANAYVATSTDDNTVSGMPIEFVAYTNITGSDLNLDLVVINANSGPSPELIKYVILAGPESSEFFTFSSTSFGHRNAEKVLAIASAAFFNIPPLFSPPQVNPDSSWGGTPIYFDIHNIRLTNAPLIRVHPNVTGPDGGNNTFFGEDSPEDPDSYPNFFGTSAAAPHVAGLAALVLENATSIISPALMERILQETALDIPEPQVGFDFASGFGLVQANGPTGAVCGDVDGDGYCINQDACPEDPHKTEPQECGCGASEKSCEHGKERHRHDSGGAGFAVPPVGLPILPIPDVALSNTENNLPATNGDNMSIAPTFAGDDSAAKETARGGSSCFAPHGQPRDLWWMVLLLTILWHRQKMRQQAEK